MSNTFGREGELLFLGEAKPMGPVEPDTINARNYASAAFLEVETQRERQARLAFERHSEANLINILMICGSFWAVWPYERSAFELDLPPRATSTAPTASDNHSSSSPDRSPPHKVPRTDKTPPRRPRLVHGTFFREQRKLGNDSDPKVLHDKDDPSGLSSPPSPPPDRRDLTWRPTPQEEPLEIDILWDHQPPKGRKAGKKAAKEPVAPAAIPSDTKKIVYHVLQLPNKDVLNPWFRRFLRETRDALVERDADSEGTVQSSWFDWHEGEKLTATDDGHAPGYVLPAAKSPSTDTAECEFVEVARADAPPELAGVVLSPSSQVAANALLSPILALSGNFGPAGSNWTPGPSRTPVPFQRFGYLAAEEDTVLPQAPEAGSADEESDTTPSPTPERRLLIPPPQRPRTREPSPTDLYTERKQQGPSTSRLHPGATASASAQPLPHQPSDDPASRPRRDTRSAGTGTPGDNASAEPPRNMHNYAPQAASTSTSTAPSRAVAGGSLPLPSTTDSRTRGHAVNPSYTYNADARADASAAAYVRARADARNADTIRIDAAAARARAAARYTQHHRDALQRSKTLWKLGVQAPSKPRPGPRLHAQRLPNGKPLPPGFFDESLADQELFFFIATPGGVDREQALLSTGISGQEARAIMRRFPQPAPEVPPATAAAEPAGPSAGSRAHRDGGGTATGVQPAAGSSSTAAAMPPPPLPTMTTTTLTTTTTTTTTLPGSAEGAPRRDRDRDRSDNTQDPRPPLPPLRAGPSTTTTSTMTTTAGPASRSRSHAGSRDRALPVAGAASSSSSSAGVRADNNNGHSSVERGGQQASLAGSNRPQPHPQRRHDPVAATGSQPSDTDPGGEGSSNRKRKDR
ncbi:hypothetical protein GSI_10176 [Ganoderma sinense ZZ0214-1]|uniref:Uncharacterized protein n=1 Tax=Ganoderma sinense ZZ0214-1 TaxID=1077348 RepID=A0A2G8RZW6_9APHY|nr:hypothetical protein GSI_10176 [Ganoderma sinense ZZ0214-1]